MRRSFEGTERMLYPQLRLCLATWCSGVKRKVSHTVMPQPLHSSPAPIYAFYQTSKSVPVRVKSQKKRDTREKNYNKLNMKLPFTRTGFSVMDINNALLLGIIELICYLNLNYGGFFYSCGTEHILSCKNLHGLAPDSLAFDQFFICTQK